MPQSLTKEALRVALLVRQPNKGLVHQSDRGSQYAAHAYRDITAALGMQTSMSRKGNCWDNAAMESANGTLKVECVNRQRYETRQQARQDVLEFIGYYNHDRAHSSLGYLSPVSVSIGQNNVRERVGTSRVDSPAASGAVRGLTTLED